MLGNLSIPDLYDAFVLELGDTAGESDEEVHTAKHNDCDKSVDSDGDTGLGVLELDVAHRGRGLHDSEIEAFYQKTASPSHTRDSA